MGCWRETDWRLQCWRLIGNMTLNELGIGHFLLPLNSHAVFWRVANRLKLHHWILLLYKYFLLRWTDLKWHIPSNCSPLHLIHSILLLSRNWKISSLLIIFQNLHLQACLLIIYHLLSYCCWHRSVHCPSCHLLLLLIEAKCVALRSFHRHLPCGSAWMNHSLLWLREKLANLILSWLLFQKICCGSGSCPWLIGTWQVKVFSTPYHSSWFCRSSYLLSRLINICHLLLLKCDYWIELLIFKELRWILSLCCSVCTFWQVRVSIVCIVLWILELRTHNITSFLISTSIIEIDWRINLPH